MPATLPDVASRRKALRLPLTTVSLALRVLALLALRVLAGHLMGWGLWLLVRRLALIGGGLGGAAWAQRGLTRAANGRLAEMQAEGNERLNRVANPRRRWPHRARQQWPL